MAELVEEKTAAIVKDEKYNEKEIENLDKKLGKNQSVQETSVKVDGKSKKKIEIIGEKQMNDKEDVSALVKEDKENKKNRTEKMTIKEKETVVEDVKVGSSEEKETRLDEDSLSVDFDQVDQELAKSLNDYSDLDNYVELELDSSSSSNSSNTSNREQRPRDHQLYIHNDLLNIDFLNDLDLDPFDVELMLENHGGHLLNLINLASSADPRPAPPPYPCSEITVTDCGVCFDEKNLRKRLCCQLPVCDECIESYLVMQINSGIVQLRCPSSECNIYIHRDEILARLPTETKDKYYRFLVDANNDPNVKTCPRCSYIHKLEKPVTSKQKSKKLRKKNKKNPDTSSCVVCPDCDLKWCFPCQAPWHENATCKEFRKGDKLLRNWAQEYRYGQNNAQKCPHCKVYIEKKGGCDHMVCIHCGTSFCYRCGERYMSLKFLGNHSSRLSPFGCRYNFLPERPAARKTIRGFYLGAKLLGMVGLGGIIVCVGALFVGTSFIILPAYGGYRYYKFRQRRKWMKRHKKFWPELPGERQSRIVREILANTVERVDKLPNYEEILMEDLPVRVSSQESSDDSNSVSEEVIAIGIQGEGSQKVEVLVHAQDQQAHSEDSQGHSKNFGKPEVKGQIEKGQIENTDEIQGKVKSDSKDHIQVTSESGGKVHVTTIEIKKDEMKNDYSPVVMHIKTTNKPESKDTTVNQSELSLQKGPVSSRETTPDLDREDRDVKSSINPDSSEHAATTHEADKKENHKNESEESGFIIEEGNAETKGCFVRIFGKKLPVVWEKEKEGEKIIDKDAKRQKESGMPTLDKVSIDGSLKRKKSSKTIKNQPDIVNCALIAEHKQKKILSLGKEMATTDDEVLSHGLSCGESCDKEEQNDPYYGLISADTIETPL